MAVSKDEILEAISNMSIMQVVELISDMEKKFGVTAAAPVAVAAVAAGRADREPLVWADGLHAATRTKQAASTVERRAIGHLFTHVTLDRSGDLGKVLDKPSNCKVR